MSTNEEKQFTGFNDEEMSHHKIHSGRLAALGTGVHDETTSPEDQDDTMGLTPSSGDNSGGNAMSTDVNMDATTSASQAYANAAAQIQQDAQQQPPPQTQAQLSQAQLSQAQQQQVQQQQAQQQQAQQQAQRQPPQIAQIDPMLQSRQQYAIQQQFGTAQQFGTSQQFRFDKGMPVMQPLLSSQSAPSTPYSSSYNQQFGTNLADAAAMSGMGASGTSATGLDLTKPIIPDENKEETNTDVSIQRNENNQSYNTQLLTLQRALDNGITFDTTQQFEILRKLGGLQGVLTLFVRISQRDQSVFVDGLTEQQIAEILNYIQQ